MIFEFVFVSNTGIYVEINGSAMDLKHLYCKELLLNEICCVKKQYHAPR